MKKILAILGIVALLCVPISVIAADGDLQTLAPLTDVGNVIDDDTKDKIKKYFVITD